MAAKMMRNPFMASSGQTMRLSACIAGLLVFSAGFPASELFALVNLKPTPTVFSFENASIRAHLPALARCTRRSNGRWVVHPAALSPGPTDPSRRCLPHARRASARTACSSLTLAITANAGIGIGHQIGSLLRHLESVIKSEREESRASIMIIPSKTLSASTTPVAPGSMPRRAILKSRTLKFERLQQLWW